jgi:hypothetical protein
MVGRERQFSLKSKVKVQKNSKRKIERKTIRIEVNKIIKGINVLACGRMMDTVLEKNLSLQRQISQTAPKR